MASPRAPEGSQRATSPNAPYDELGSTTAPAGQQQQVDEVGGGQRRLGAQHPGHQQPERGERRGARARTASTAPEHAAGRVAQPSARPTAQITTTCSTSTTSSAPTLPASSPERGSGEAPSRLMTP